MDNVVISLKEIKKEFKTYNSNIDKIRSLLVRINDKGIVNAGVHDLNFDICKGENVAILGGIGSGKSITAKLISGILYPTAGRLRVKDKVTYICDLRNGFVSDFSGRYNLYTMANLLGWDKKTIQENEADIIDFAEVGEIIDKPIKTYKKGESARIGFSLQTHFTPEILILDNPIAVGDYRIREKFIKRLVSFKNDPNVTLLIVANNFPLVRELCDRALVFDKGTVVFDGEAKEAVNFYRKNILSKMKKNRIENEEDADSIDESEEIDESGEFDETL